MRSPWPVAFSALFCPRPARGSSHVPLHSLGRRPALMTGLLLSLLVLSCRDAHSQCDPNYPLGSVSTFQGLSYPHAIAAADLNNDHHLDVVVANSAFGGSSTDSGSVQVFRGTGTGSF